MAKTSELKLTSSFDLFTKSKDAIKNNVWLYIAVNIVPFVLFALIMLPLLFLSFSGFADEDKVSAVKSFNVLAVIIGIAFVMFFVSIYTAIVTFTNLRLAQNKKPSFEAIWKDSKSKFVDIFFAQILAGLMVILGFILLVVPGFFMIRRYYLVSYFVADQGLSPVQALKKCKEQSIKASGYVFGLLGVTLLLSLTGIIPLIGGILSMVLGFLYGVAPALRYLEIKKL